MSTRRPQPSPPAGPAPIALWRLLQSAAAVVQAVRQGASATPQIAAVPLPLRAGTQALAFQALRQLGRAQALRAQLARRAPPPAADALLCTALALAWDEAHAPYAPFTLVDQAVEAAKRSHATAHHASFINACLRRFLRERDALVQATADDPVARWNHPAWWIDRLRRDHPAAWQDILAVSNSQPPLVLRVNRLRWTPEAAREALAAAGIDALPVGAHGLLLPRARPVHELPGFEAGKLSVQDAAAQMAAPLLLDGVPTPPGRPLRILDACAAPGGKTAHLLELTESRHSLPVGTPPPSVTPAKAGAQQRTLSGAQLKAEVTALDIDPTRCERIQQNLSRLGLQAKILAADAARPDLWWDGQPFDAILLDAPCTASGIVRRHPDVRWLRRESDIATLAATQARLLEALWPLLAEGGRLLYCTCSLFPAEGREQADAFLAHHKEALLLPSPGHLLPRSAAATPDVPDNRPSDHDGFYYALLQKQPSVHSLA